MKRTDQDYHTQRSDKMTERVVNRKTIPDILFERFRTENMCIRETEDGFFVRPVKEGIDHTAGLRGMFAGHPELSVDDFLKMMHAEKELEP